MPKCRFCGKRIGFGFMRDDVAGGKWVAYDTLGNKHVCMKADKDKHHIRQFDKRLMRGDFDNPLQYKD